MEHINHLIDAFFKTPVGAVILGAIIVLGLFVYLPALPYIIEHLVNEWKKGD